MATKPIIAFFLLLLFMIIVTASVQQDSKNFMYKVSEGDFFYKKGMFDNAIEAYDEAINISPNNSVVLQKKGDALYGQGRYDDAAKAYDKAIEFDPRITKPSIWQHIDELLNKCLCQIIAAIIPSFFALIGPIIGFIGGYLFSIRSQEKIMKRQEIWQKEMMKGQERLEKDLKDLKK